MKQKIETIEKQMMGKDQIIKDLASALSVVFRDKLMEFKME